MQAARVYFPSLNGLRFLAAFAVLVHHIEMYCSKKLHTNYPLPGDLGGLGVTLFFVLSGFLITYLLLVEKKQTHTISIKEFYLRRILRIWPLYFFILLLSLTLFPFFLFPESTTVFEQLAPKLILYLFLMANLGFLFFPEVPVASVLWSVGVEEQFYLIWPWLIKGAGKGFILFLLVFIPGFALLRFCMQFIGDNYFIQYNGIIWSNKLLALSRVMSDMRFDCMATGALAAMILFYEKKHILEILFHRTVQFVVFIVLIIALIIGFTVPNFNHNLYSIFFGILILNLAANPKAIFSLEYSFFDFMGRISYGFYVYHTISILVALKFIPQLFSEYGLVFKGSMYIFCFAFTTVISYLSYAYFETRFLKLKHRFSKVISGPEAKS